MGPRLAESTARGWLNPSRARQHRSRKKSAKLERQEAKLSASVKPKPD